jgi:hypothetical protein
MTTRSIVPRQRDDNAASEASRLVRESLEEAGRAADDLIHELIKKNRRQWWPFR